MTLKEEEPPLVPATLVGASEPEYNLHASAPPAPVAQPYVVNATSASMPPQTTPFVQAIVNKPAPVVQGVSSLPTTTTTTTTYSIPPPAQPTAAPGSYGNLGRNSCNITCQYCRTQCNTRTHDRVDAVTILLVIVLLLVFWPLFWLPLVVPCCKTTEHCCGHCNRVVGRTEPCD